MRVTVPLALGERRPAWLERALEGAVPGLLAALVATGAAADAQDLRADPRLVGLAAAACAIALLAPPLLILFVAAGVTALLRAV
jgi:hypothetical protein